MNKTGGNDNRGISTQIKNPDLIRKRRKQIIDAVVPLFIEKGFHKTTTRQIALAAGFSIGTLYEYVACKEDVLYLVCEDIHDKVAEGIGHVLSSHKEGREALSAIIREYFTVCHRMSDVILLMYQETHALPSQWIEKVLTNELRITGIIQEALHRIFPSSETGRLNTAGLNLIAHNITVLGHMWVFRRWALSRVFSIGEYIELQTKLIFPETIGSQTE
ncbi:MAG: TetR/AcrR family transcriptional regulator [Desulfobacterales bacterium]|jgi:AcrR family transcriptional regulator|nr:TetR/AcrR family transcriptional regulator [Desulfobacterales bacterium]